MRHLLDLFTIHGRTSAKLKVRNVQTVLAGTIVPRRTGQQAIKIARDHFRQDVRKRFVRLTVGDRVKMQMSQYDLNKARIVWRIG